jgi:hypothetical protein
MMKKCHKQIFVNEGTELNIFDLRMKSVYEKHGLEDLDHL